MAFVWAEWSNHKDVSFRTTYVGRY